MSNKLYWVWAQNALGISASVKSDEIVSYFGNAESFITPVNMNGRYREYLQTDR